jgi:hypothetical protein
MAILLQINVLWIYFLRRKFKIIFGTTIDSSIKRTANIELFIMQSDPLSSVPSLAWGDTKMVFVIRHRAWMEVM